MGRHEDKHCQRCGMIFECKVGCITECQCYGISLSEAEQQYISKQFTDCLCFTCIKDLRFILNAEKLTNLLKKHPGH